MMGPGRGGRKVRSENWFMLRAREGVEFMWEGDEGKWEGGRRGVKSGSC